MKELLIFLAIVHLSFTHQLEKKQKVFDVHLHGSSDVPAQIAALEKAGVYKAAVSTSWNFQSNYQKTSKIQFLYGLMFPCPNGKVPYSLQPCFENSQEWPPIEWVEAQIKDNKINFFGEILSQYYGISSSDTLLYPYYALAEKYRLPVGIHTGGAGPNHGSPNFKIELGNPVLIEKLISSFPKLKIWIMHSGDQYFKEAIPVMQKSKRVYADISVISNPEIVHPDKFASIMKGFIDAGLEDRLMFGTDNGDIDKVIKAVEELQFLTKKQKEKIFYRNAENFFKKKQNSK